MNEYQIKIVGASELGQSVDTTQSLTVTFDCDVYSAEKIDLQNGDFIIRYKAKVISPITYTQNQKTVKARDKTKASQRLRFALMEKARAEGREPEEFYQQSINKFISQL